MLRKTSGQGAESVVGRIASMRPQRNAAENEAKDMVATHMPSVLQ